MAIRKFNAYQGISVGDDIITYDVIDNVGNVTANNLVVNNTSNLGAVGNITITGGTSGYVLRTDGAGNLSWVNPSAAGVAGSNTQIQFNDNTSFGASANFTFNKSTNTLAITNSQTVNANVSGNLYVTGAVNFTSASSVTLGNFAGTLTTSAQPNITSTGTLVSLNVSGNITTGNADLGNLATANYFSGDGSLLTGIELANLVDVALNSPINGQILGYNGVNWVNVNNTGGVSAGAGVDFFFTGPQLIAQNANNYFQIDSLSSEPNATQTTMSMAINNTTAVIVAGRYPSALNRTQLDGGVWDFSVYANVDSTGGTTQISTGMWVVTNPSETYTTTGTGTSRTATASGGTPFAGITASADIRLASYLRTAQGLYQITAKTSDTVVTIATPSTYVNETSSAGAVANPYVLSGWQTITSTSLSLFDFVVTASTRVVNTTDTLGWLLFGSTTNNKTLYTTMGGTLNATHITSPLATSHNDLAGLQGGQSSEYYHLTTSEYTGTGTGDFVRKTSPTLTTPNIGAATGTSLVVTGNITSGNASLGNLTTSNYFSGNGSLLSSITGANVTGTVANANYSAYAGNITIASQPNITSLGTLTSLNITGNVTSGNASLGNLVVANYFSGDGGYLSNLQISSATVANSNYANYAGNVINASQPNITSLGTLSSLTSNGTINFTNASNVALGNVSNVYISGGQDGQILVTDGAGNLQWVDNNPTTVTYLANSITQTHGVYVTGDLYSIQVFGDYLDPDGVYVLTDGTGAAPAWVVDVDFVSVTNFNRVVMNINYTLASGHTIYVQLYNYSTSFSLASATVTTTTGTNIVTVSSTTNMAAGQVIIFGTSVGGLTAGTPYYILSVPSSTELTVGTGTSSGTIVTLSNDSQTSTVAIQNWDNIGTYTGLGAYYAFALQVIDDTNYINSGQVKLRLDHSNQGNATHQTSIDYVALELSSQGPQGPRGPTGATGNTGPGVATGGTTGQVLVKNSATNYDTAWTSTISITGNITVGNASLGNLVTANYISGNGSLLTSITGGNVTGQVGNALVAGTVYTNAQPNITSVGTLSSLNITGNVTSGNADLGNLVVANYFSGDGGYLSNLQISSATVANANYANYAGNVVNADQSNITSLGTLVSLSVTGNVTSGNANLGNLATANYFSGNGYLLNHINGSNVTGQVGNALVAGTVYTNAQPNITSVGTLTSLNVTGNITSGNASLGNLVSANYFGGDGGLLSNITGGNVTGQVANALVAGTVYSNAQPNITSVGTLSSLTVTGNIEGGNINAVHDIHAINIYAGNLLAANYFQGDGSALSNVTSSSGTATYALTAGTVVANNQPNITSVGTLTSLIVSGNVTSGNASLGNLVTASYFQGDGSLLTNITGANVTGTVANANYAAYAGNVVNASQGNITSLGTLSGLSVSGNATITGNLTVSGTTIYANVSTLNVKDPIIEMGGNPNGDPLTTNDGKDRGTLLHYFNGAAIDAFMGWDASNSEFGFGSNVSVTNEVVTWNNYGNIRASYFLGNGSQLTGTIGLANYSAYAGNVTVASQPNITSLGTLTSLDVTGNVTSGNANLGNLVVANYFSGDGGYLSNLQISSATVANANYANYAGNVVNATQSNITSLGTLTSLSVTGNISSGNANLGNLATANYFSGNGALLTHITGANVSGTVGSATTAGTVTTNAQPNITSVGTLTGLAVSGGVSASYFLGPLANGQSNVSIPTIDGNVNIVSNGNTTLVVTPTGGNVTGTFNVTGKLIAGYLQGEGGNISNIQGANVSGTVALATDATTAGTVTTNAQPNITSTGTLSSLNVTGNISSGANLYGKLFSSTSTTLHVPGPGNVTGERVRLYDFGNPSSTNFAIGVEDHYIWNAVDATTAGFKWYAGNVVAATLIGNGQFTTTGNITAVNANLGNLVVANYFSGDGGYLSNLQISSATVANANYANFAGQVVDSTQSNITSLGTLTSLTVSGNITSGNANLGNLVVANYFSGDGGYLSNLQISGATVANANYANYAGNVVNSAQGNITSLGTLSGLTSTGTVNFTTASNVSLGAVGNVHITGGANKNVLQTNGTGTLSWGALAATVDTFTGDGSQVDFGLSIIPASKNLTMINYNGAIMMKADYSLSGATITISSPPAVGAKLEVTTFHIG